MTPLIGSVPFPPIPFAGSDGRNHLVYELSLTNFTDAPVVVEGLRVVDQAGGQLADLDGAATRARLQPAGSRDSSDRLLAGQSGTLFVHLLLAADAPIPDTLTHDVTVTSAAMPPGSNRPTIALATTDVDRRTLPVLAAPLRGERYIAADGCCDAVRHTRAILPINGRVFVAQRYAIDYEQADDQNRIYTGDAREPSPSHPDECATTTSGSTARQNSADGDSLSGCTVERVENRGVSAVSPRIPIRSLFGVSSRSSKRANCESMCRRRSLSIASPTRTN
jgi:hypothetical protein